MVKAEVLVVGAGLSGLACALRLQQRGYAPVLLEREQHVGGRVATDAYEGFLLDRGFQVFLTAYPAARRLLDYPALNLRAFRAGALIYKDGVFHRLGDPLRDPKDLLPTLLFPLATFSDKLRVLALRLLQGLGPASDVSTEDYLANWGFSQLFRDAFFRPFFGGVFLERDLLTRAAKFRFLFSMFSRGQAAVPARGMGQLAEQLASRLSKQDIHLGTEVSSVSATSLKVGRKKWSARAIVLAGAQQQALWDGNQTSFHSTETFYYACKVPPVQEPILVLNGGSGPINNLTVMSLASSHYAPNGRHLISISAVDRKADRHEIEDQLLSWYGESTREWEFLRSYSIERALPLEYDDLRRPAQLEDGLFVCGDHRESGSIQGALSSGIKTAAAVHRYLKGNP